MTSSSENPHLGTALDDFLAEDGLLKDADLAAVSRTSAWQEAQRRRSLWQVAQSGYDVFVFRDDDQLMRVTDDNADALGVSAGAWASDVAEAVLGRTSLDFEPRRAADLYVVYSAASSSRQQPHELCVNRDGAGGDTVYVSGFGDINCRCQEPAHAIRLGGVGSVRRAFGDGHAIRYDGKRQLPSGECYDLIRHHLRRIAHIAQVSLDAPALDLGHGDVERSLGHEGIALRGGDGPGSVSGGNCRDDRPGRGRRKQPLYGKRSLEDSRGR